MKDADFEELNLENEKEEDYDLSSKRTIFTEQGDPEVDSLYRRHLKGRLNIQPSFQRQFVWDKLKSSKLIESALLDIPIPIIYLSEEQDGKDNVIDGQQRLTAFFSFIDGKFPDNTDFKLTALNVFRELNGKKFKELPEETQEKILTTKVRVIKFKKESDGELQFEIFARLNTGAVPLNDQELRNCVYRGRFNELLKELSEERDFRYLLGLSKPEKRMRDVELVLRFASFYFNSYLDYNSPIKGFLNGTMKKFQNISPDDENNLRNAFKNTLVIIRSLFDKNAFKRFYSGREKNSNGRWETQKFNVSLYDILMYSFAKEDKNAVYQNLDRIREALLDLMTTDQDFIDSIELGTSSKKMVTIRFDKWRLTLQSILGIGSKEPRCFSYALKQQLFENESICSICGNRILNIDDAAVDHIDQYWTGGKTIPENARLSHRFCNNSRPRTDKITKSPESSEQTVFDEVSKHFISDSGESKIDRGITYVKSDKEKQRIAFFEQFLAVCNRKTNLLYSASPVGYQDWILVGAGISGLAWCIECWKKFSRLSLVFRSASLELNKARFQVFYDHREEIEDECGEKLEWDFRVNKVHRGIRSTCYIGGMEDEGKWAEIHHDLVEKLIRLEQAAKPYLSQLNKSYSKARNYHLNPYEENINSSEPFDRISKVKKIQNLDQDKRRLDFYVFVSYNLSMQDFVKYLSDKYISDKSQRELFLLKGVWMKVRLNYIAGLILTIRGRDTFTPKDIRGIIREELIPSISIMDDQRLSSIVLTQDVHDKAKKEYNNGHPCLKSIGDGTYRFIGLK